MQAIWKRVALPRLVAGSLPSGCMPHARRGTAAEQTAPASAWTVKPSQVRRFRTSNLGLRVSRSIALLAEWDPAGGRFGQLANRC